jgi:short-subunit dehydrogenase
MDRPVVVTGASRGIGRALALALAERRRDLLLCARSAGDLEAVAGEARSRGVEVRAVPCDLATVEGREELVRACPAQLGGLVNNAGFGTAGEFASQDRGREREMVRLNVEAVVDLTHALLPRLPGGSFIVNVSSTAGFQPVPLFATYAATKAFVLSFSEALAEELAREGIHVMALCPGVTVTDFQRVANVQLAGPTATAEGVAPTVAAPRAALRSGAAGKAALRFSRCGRCGMHSGVLRIRRRGPRPPCPSPCAARAWSSRRALRPGARARSPRA